MVNGSAEEEERVEGSIPAASAGERIEAAVRSRALAAWHEQISMYEFYPKRPGFLERHRDAGGKK